MALGSRLGSNRDDSSSSSSTPRYTGRGISRRPVVETSRRPQAPERKGGFLNLGIGQAFRELGQGLHGLVELGTSLAPGGQKSQLPQFARGFGASVAGTVSTGLHGVGLGGVSDKYFEPAVGSALGVRPQDFGEKFRERGFAPALIEDLGNVSLIAGGAGAAAGATKAVTGGARAAAAGEGVRAGMAAGRAASRANRAGGLLEKAAHPYRTGAIGASDLVEASWRRVQAPRTVGPARPLTAAEHVADAQGTPRDASTDLVESLQEVQSAHEAAAGTIAASRAAKADMKASGLLNEAQEGLASETGVREAEAGRPGSAANEEMLRQVADEGPVQTVYRARGGEWVEDQKIARQAADAADGVVEKLDIPETTYKTAGVPDEWARVAEVMSGPETAGVKNIEGQKLVKMDPESTSAVLGAVDEGRAAAGVEPGVVGTPQKLAEVAARMEPSPWAMRMADRMPTAARSVLASMHAPVSRYRVRQVSKALEQSLQTAQRVAQRSNFVTAAQAAAVELLKNHPSTDRFAVSAMIGQEIAARADGTSWMAAAIRDGADPVAAAKLREIAKRRFTGIPAELRNQLDADTAAKLDALIDTAVEAYKGEKALSLKNQVADRYGARGLEAAILNSDSPVMSRSETRAYNRAMGDIRRAEALRLRSVDEVTQIGAEAAKRSKLAAFYETSASRKRMQAAEASARTQDLHVAVPKGLQNLDLSVQRVLDEMAFTAQQSAGAFSGATLDVGTGQISRPTTGFGVGIGLGADAAELFDVTAAEFYANPRPILENHLRQHQNIWTHDDRSRFGIWAYTDPQGIERIAADVSFEMPTRDAAVLMGEIRGQKAIYDFEAGADISMSQDPQFAAIAAHYIDEAMNPNSSVMRGMRQMRESAVETGMDAAEVDQAMRAWISVDYSLSRAKGEKPGAFFKSAEWGTGKKPPTREYLAQTVLNISTEEGVNRALAEMDYDTVNDALAWYYDSHDYVESMYRGKPMTLLNGTVRDAAEVFYDLLAVTSVMASPKQNLGRALSAMANMSDLLQTQGKAASIAKRLMKQWEAMPPGVDDNGLSAVFNGIPELQQLTDQTSMVTSPKYNVLDILRGKLDLTTATTRDIARLPEDWTGKTKSLGTTNVPRDVVAARLPDDHPYQAWFKQYDHVRSIRAKVRADATRKGISDSEAFKKMVGKGEFSTYGQLNKAWENVKRAEEGVLDEAGAAMLDTVTMEHHGSTALAKLRSFRDNLANPDTSSAVTLDSVMSRLYGFSGTDWSGGGTYLAYADDVRRQAAALSTRLGREVKPHEVQALLWVYAKKEIGRQDWGRAIAAHDNAHATIERSAGHLEADPMAQYWDEELSYSREALQIRERRTYLTRKQATVAKYGMKLDAEDAAELEGLQAQDVSGVRTEPVFTALDREDLAAMPDDADGYAFEDRHHLAYDAKKLVMQEDRYNNYRYNVLPEMERLVAEGDTAGAKGVLTQWLTSQQRALKGDVGGSFQMVGEQTRNAAGDVAATSEARLGAKRSPAVPKPNPWMTKYVSSQAARYNRKYGLAPPEPVDTTARVNPDRTAEVAAAYDALPADNEMTPTQYARAEESYGVLKDNVRQQWRFLTEDPDGPQITVEWVHPDNEYGSTVLGKDGYPDPVNSHKELVEDVRTNKRLKIRDTELAGDEPGTFMQGVDPETGVSWNNMLRAVHDFFGHAQAGNNFSRHGENTAMRLHMETLPPGAYPALASEFRGQTAYLIDRGEFPSPQKGSVEWGEEMLGKDYMVRGDATELHQSAGETLRGATLLPTNGEGRSIVRLFKEAGLDTLFHENAHLLRQILPEKHMKAVRKAYPGIGDATLTARRVAGEEAFVADMMAYIESSGQQLAGTVHRPDMHETFGKVAATLESVYGQLMPSQLGPLTPDIRNFWDRMFMPEVVSPAKTGDVLRTDAPRGIETRKYRWESDAEALQRARMYGESRTLAPQLQKDAAFLERKAQKLRNEETKLLAAMGMPTKADRIADKLDRRAMTALDNINASLADKVPENAAWRPMHDAWVALREEADRDPTGQLSDMLSEIPESFADVIAKATEQGFSPTHVADMGWETAQSRLFGHIQLGRQGDMGSTTQSASRKKNTGAMVRMGAADRSIEALAAASVEVLRERYSNMAVDFLETNYARPIEKGQVIPEGWTAWEPEKTWALTGADVSADQIARVASGQSSMIVPSSVAQAVRGMGQRYDHWAFHTISRVTSPWRTFVLTLSPRWYINNVIGNAVLATTEGVRMADWKASWQRMRSGDRLPQFMDTAITSFEEGQMSLIPRSVRETRRTEGIRPAMHKAREKLVKVNTVVDEFGRTAVYERHMRTGASREAALQRGFDAMVNYGDLSPIERSLVRSVMPFYAWQKGMFKLVARFPADHPVATVALQQLGLMHEERLKDQFGGEIPSAYYGLTMTPFGQHNLRSWNPMLDAGSLATPDGIAQAVNPFVDAIIRDVYDAPENGFADAYRLGPTGQAVPDVNAISMAFETIQGTPQAQLGTSLTGGEVYGQEYSATEAAGRFAGVPREYSDAEIAAAMERIAKSAPRRDR